MSRQRPSSWRRPRLTCRRPWARAEQAFARARRPLPDRAAAGGRPCAVRPGLWPGSMRDDLAARSRRPARFRRRDRGWSARACSAGSGRASPPASARPRRERLGRRTVRTAGAHATGRSSCGCAANAVSSVLAGVALTSPRRRQASTSAASVRRSLGMCGEGGAAAAAGRARCGRRPAPARRPRACRPGVASARSSSGASSSAASAGRPWRRIRSATSARSGRESGLRLEHARGTPVRRRPDGPWPCRRNPARGAAAGRPARARRPGVRIARARSASPRRSATHAFDRRHLRVRRARCARRCGPGARPRRGRRGQAPAGPA